jgi:hypothetical protein
VSYTPAFNSVFFIGTQKPASVVTDYTSDTWQQVTGIKSVGEIGDKVTEIKFETLDSPRPHKMKGTRDAGSFELTAGFLANDPGQVAMRAAAASNDSTPFNFRVALKDGSIRYFSGLVMSAEGVTGSDANAVQMEKYTISITGAPLIVLAAA